MIDLELLLSDRDDYTLADHRHKCFALILDTGVLSALAQFIDTINQFNPLRVRLEPPSHFFVDDKKILYTEMLHNDMPNAASYFTFLFWLFSGKHLVWIHLWDTTEHDVFRRDFDCPAYLDSSLCINRLWIKSQTIHMLNRGFTPDNPHGELIKELVLAEALECIEAGEYEIPTNLNDAVTIEFTEGPAAHHFLGKTVDVCEVYIPRQLAGLIASNTSLIRHFSTEGMNPAKAELWALPDYVDLNDEIAYKVALPEVDPKSQPPEVPVAQALSVSLKILADRFLHEAKETTQLEELMASMQQEIPLEAFSSAYLQKGLQLAGLLKEFHHCAENKECPPRLEYDWTKPFSLIKDTNQWNADKAKEFADSQKYFAEALASMDSNFLAQQEPESFESIEDSRAVTDFLKDQVSKMKATLASQTPLQADSVFDDELGLHESLDPEELEKLDELNDFDDFVEFFASHYMGFSPQDLQSHQSNKRTATEVEWEDYNDDSDYVSD